MSHTMGKCPRKSRCAPYRDSHSIDDDYRPGTSKTTRVKKNKNPKEATPKIFLKLKLKLKLKLILKSPVLGAEETRVNVEGDISQPPMPNPPIAPIAKKIFDPTPLHPMEYGPHKQPETEPFPTIDFSLGEPYTESHCFLHCRHIQRSRLAHRQEQLADYYKIRRRKPVCTCKQPRPGMKETAELASLDWRQLADDEIFVIKDEATQIINKIKQTPSFMNPTKLRDSQEFSCFRTPVGRTFAARAAGDHCFEEIETFFKISFTGTKNTSLIDTPRNLKNRLLASLGLKLCEYIKHCTLLEH
ncbi:hypothetical protein BDV96DRAFT_603553 [Lophiotrema nucula]|uniref:Uncharacterized protein n=1 Tax=Lophiotrema nucula TaxID=690887 RepID=A0A6A5YUY9_9PLEO|nr:hypothetical protein BDV96DRAFT_603553 [Lophiotrema nucula]